MCPLAFVISWFVPLQRAPATWLIYLPSLSCFRHGVWAQGSTEYWANHTQLWHLVILPKYLLHILFLVLPSILRWDLVCSFLGAASIHTCGLVLVVKVIMAKFGVNEMNNLSSSSYPWNGSCGNSSSVVCTAIFVYSLSSTYFVRRLLQDEWFLS